MTDEPIAALEDRNLIPPEPEDQNITYKTILDTREIEQTFAGCVAINSQEALKKCGWLDPGKFTTLRIRKFWRIVKEEKQDPIQAAIATDCYPDIIKWMNQVPFSYSLFPEIYGEEIQRRAWMMQMDPEIARMLQARNTYDVEGLVGSILKLASYKESIPGEDIPDAADATIELNCLLGNTAKAMVRTYIPKIDQALGGYEVGYAHILAAQPSFGKTTLAFEIARNVAAHELAESRAGREAGPVLYFSLEQRRVSLWLKAACGKLAIPAREVLAGRASAWQVSELYQISDQLQQAYEQFLRIDDRSEHSISTIWRAAAHYKPRLVVIDALGMVKERGATRQDRLNQAIQGANGIAKDLICPVLCIHHTNRDSANRDDKLPNLTDLADCADLERYAETVSFLHSDHFYQTGEVLPLKMPLKMIIAKNRQASRNDCVNLIYDTQAQWIE